MPGQDTTRSVLLDDNQQSRRIAVRQIHRRRRFHMELTTSIIGMCFLSLVWATSEYHNSSGWPSKGFSQSSGLYHVWNIWIIYPLTVWIIILSVRAWSVYGNKSITEDEIRREITRSDHSR